MQFEDCPPNQEPPKSNVNGEAITLAPPRLPEFDTDQAPEDPLVAILIELRAIRTLLEKGLVDKPKECCCEHQKVG